MAARGQQIQHEWYATVISRTDLSAIESSPFVPDGQATSLLTDTYREIMISQHLNPLSKISQNIAKLTSM